MLSSTGQTSQNRGKSVGFAVFLAYRVFLALVACVGSGLVTVLEVGDNIHAIGGFAFDDELALIKG